MRGCTRHATSWRRCRCRCRCRGRCRRLLGLGMRAARLRRSANGCSSRPLHLGAAGVPHSEEGDQRTMLGDFTCRIAL